MVVRPGSREGSVGVHADGRIFIVASGVFRPSWVDLHEAKQETRKKFAPSRDLGRNNSASTAISIYYHAVSGCYYMSGMCRHVSFHDFQMIISHTGVDVSLSLEALDSALEIGVRAKPAWRFDRCKSF